MSREGPRPPSRGPEDGRGGRRTEASPRKARPWSVPRLILLFGALFLAMGLGVRLWSQMGAKAPAAGAASQATASVGGPFQLVDQNGRPANQSLLQGKWTALFFGYTYCPDVCPATLSALKVVKDRLGAKAKDLQVVFVSVDPQRDTPAQLKLYLSTPAFPQPITGLTGSPAQVAVIAKAYKVYYAKRGTGTDYTVDHASAVYLIDPKGQFRTLVSDSDGLDSMTADIGTALSQG